MFGFGLTLIVASISGWRPASKRVQAFESVGSRLAAPSYTLYLLHYPILAFWNFVDPNRFDDVGLFSLGVFVMRLSVCGAIVFGFFAVFESRTSQLRAWIKIRGRPEQASRHS